METRAEMGQVAAQDIHDRILARLAEKDEIDMIFAADRLEGADKHQSFADEILDQSIVLLKNEGGLLPLDPAKRQRILVAGPLADETNYMISRYGPNGLAPISILQGIRDRVGDRADVTHSKGCDTADPGWPHSEIVPVPPSAEEQSAIDEAVAAARSADVVTYDSVLRGFEKVFLKPGECRRVTFALQPSDLCILDREMRWLSNRATSISSLAPQAKTSGCGVH